MLRDRAPSSVARRVAGVAMSMTLAACSKGADETLEKVASWGATARMAAESRAAHTTSARYTSDVLHAAHAEMVDVERSLDETLAKPDGAPGLDGAQRQRARFAARSVERALATMATSADRAPDDVGALLGLGARADSAARIARTLSDSVGGR